MARRFEAIAVGDQLMNSAWRAAPYFIVTDVWFDPVRGFKKRESGEMVAVRAIGSDGQLKGPKLGHTIRGLAAQGFVQADIDYISIAAARHQGIADGVVVPIRKPRPLLPTKIWKA